MSILIGPIVWTKVLRESIARILTSLSTPLHRNSSCTLMTINFVLSFETGGNFDFSFSNLHRVRIYVNRFWIQNAFQLENEEKKWKENSKSFTDKNDWKQNTFSFLFEYKFGQTKRNGTERNGTERNERKRTNSEFGKTKRNGKIWWR